MSPRRPAGRRRGQLVDAVAQPGVHDERELLAAARLADLFEVHPVPVRLNDLPWLQPPTSGPADAARRQLVGQHAPAVRLGEPVADGGDAVRQRAGLEPEGRAVGEDAARLGTGRRAAQRVVEESSVPQPVEERAA